MNFSDFSQQILAEDGAFDDLFARVFDENFSARAEILAREDGVFSGEFYAQKLCDFQDLNIIFHKKDGENFTKNDILCEITGNFCKILQTERALLNIIAHSSGIATNARNFIQILKGTQITLLDTRKTRPLLRKFEKYSARNGGVVNHRYGLHDCLMLKDTHMRHIKNLESFIINARKKIPWTAKIEVECENFDAAKNAMECGADIVMCDNLDPKTVREIANFRDKNFPKVLLEASGGINLQNLRDFTKIGVDAISIGAIIHQARFVDLSMKMREKIKKATV